MKPSESAYRKLKQWQKALKLTDEDTGLVGEVPDLTQPPVPEQTGPKQEDLDLYRQIFTEALQRQLPLQESDRKELEYYRQVFRISEEESSEIEQQLVAQMQSSTNFPDELDQAVSDRLPETTLPPNSTTQPNHAPSFGSTTPPTLRNQGVSANRGAVMGTAKQRFEANQAMNLGQTLPLKDHAQRSFAEARSTDPTIETAASDQTHQPSASPFTGTSASNPQGLEPHTAMHSPPQTSPSGSNDPSQTVVQPPDPSAEAPGGANVRAKPAAGTESNAEPPVPAQQKPTIDKRVAIPLIAALCGLTAFGIIAWMANSSLFQPKAQAPQAAEQLVKVGAERNQRREYREAITTFNDATRLNPKSVSAHINRGYAYHQLGELNSAANDYKRAIELDPNSAIARSNLSHVQYDQKKYDEAARSAEQAIKLQPNLAEAHLNLGNALLASNNPDGALQKFKATLQLPISAATRAKASNNIGNIHAARNQLQDAKKQYDEALQNEANYADASYNRGIVFERLGDRAAAIQDLTRAAKLYADQGNDRLSTQAQRRAEQLQRGSSSQPQQQPQPQPNNSNNSNQRSI